MGKTIRIKCHSCDKEFDKNKAEYNRRVKQGHDKFYCSAECVSKKVSESNKRHKAVQKKCLWCEKEFMSSTAKKARKCCSNNCAQRYSSNVDKKERCRKIGEALRGRPTNRPVRIVYLKCKVCKKTFIRNCAGGKILNCSPECYRKYVSEKNRNNSNCGGETNYKRYKYKNITMDSSWEVDLAKWMDDQKIKWVRSRKIWFKWKDQKGSQRRYYPDFYLPDLDVYLDPKNKYLMQKDDFKLKRVIKTHSINLISGELDFIKKQL